MSSPSDYNLPPKHVEVLIIGGGPAGSYAAAALAREGIQAAVYEASKFPRYHVGESLIPSVRHYLRFIGAEDKLASYGFTRKPGSAIKFNQFKREGYTDFVALGHNNNSWNVVRSEFDHMLMNHARSTGAAVYEQTKITSVQFSPTDPTRPTSVSWVHTPPAALPSPPASPRAAFSFSNLWNRSRASSLAQPVQIKGTTSFTHLIDASGRAGIMSTQYLKNRHFNASLKNVAAWGYWRDVGTYGVGTARHGAPWFEALTDESGWAWFIPLHNGTTSVGIVMNQEVYNEKMQQPLPWHSPFEPSNTPNAADSSFVARYLANLALAPGVLNLITENGKMDEGSVKNASDFSYSSPEYAGTGYRIIGDAGAFIDPFFSSGIHLAMTSALAAASTICASLRGDCSEEEAVEWHNKRVATSYTRFQVVVLSAYKQIRSQSTNVLSDIDENNFDRAFAYLRPVIQGASDMGTNLSETELQKSLDFCVNLFNPTSPEQHADLLRSGKVTKELLDVTSPVVDPATFEDALHVERMQLDSPMDTDASPDSEEVAETKMVLDKINARRLVHAEYAINNMESEPLGGYVVRLETGKLGLVKVAAD